MSHPFANYLRMYRRRAGLSQEEVAFALETEVGTISRYESGGRQPGLHVALAYEALLGVPVRALFAGMFASVEGKIAKRARRLVRNIGAATPRPLSCALDLPNDSGPACVPATVLRRVMALQPTHRCMGFAVLEGPERLVNFGLKTRVHEGRRLLLQILRRMWRDYRPDLLVFEDPSARSFRKGRRMRNFIHAAAAFAMRQEIRVRLIPWSRVRSALGLSQASKLSDVCEVVGERFPELRRNAPPPRKSWMSKDERMAIFEAAALGLAAFPGSLSREAHAAPAFRR